VGYDFVNCGVGCGEFVAICVFSIILFKFLLPTFAVALQVKWENRNIDYVGGLCRVVVDGTDFRVQEPTPLDPSFYSHKFKAAGLRYEVATAISTGWICWVNGPFKCGDWPDIKIAREPGGIQENMGETECYIADAGYRDGEQFAFCPNGQNNNPDQRRQKLLRARHETVNGRFKRFTILSSVFCNDLNKHRRVFLAIANIVQLEIELEVPVFEVL